MSQTKARRAKDSQNSMVQKASNSRDQAGDGKHIDRRPQQTQQQQQQNLATRSRPRKLIPSKTVELVVVDTENGPDNNSEKEDDQEDIESHEQSSSENDKHKDAEDESKQEPKKGINKLFDLMKMDLGEHQTGEMKNFYERMSTQIKELCTAQNDNQSNMLGVTEAPNNGGKDEDDNQDQSGTVGGEAGAGESSQSQLNQVFLLSLLQYQKQKILQESAAGGAGGLVASVGQQINNNKSAITLLQSNNDEDEDSANDGESSNEKVVYDERPGEPCLVDNLENRVDDGNRDTKKVVKDPFQHMKVKLVLKPLNDTTSQHLIDKSSNNINPFVIVEAEACTKVTTLIGHMASKLFKEDPAKIFLRVHQSKFTSRKCEQKGFKVQDLLLAEEPERLETALSGDKAIKLVVKYAIRESSDREQDSQSDEDDADEDNIEVPDDISEIELMETLKDVWSIMVFNKDEQQLNKYAGSVAEFDLKAKMQHPSDLLLGERSRRKRRNKALAKHQQQDHMGTKDNEKSEMSQTSQARRREAKLQAKQAKKTRPLAERLSEYQKSQREKFEKARGKRDQQVQKFIIRKQQQMREKIENWYNTGEMGTGNQQGGYHLNCNTNENNSAESNNNGVFQTVEEMINFRTNPYYDNLVKFNKYQHHNNGVHHQQ